MGVKYARREDVKGALDVAETARSDARIDRALESASRSVEKLCRRKFHPTLATRYFDWPGEGRYSRSWRLWLDGDEVLEVTALVSGGTTIASSDYHLEPANDGPPYDRIEIDLASSAAFRSGDTHQRAIAITGVFGGWSQEEQVADALGVIAVDHSTLTFSDPSMLGVGDTVRIDDEYIFLVGRGYADSAQNLQADLNASQAAAGVDVQDGEGYAAGEVILIDSEAMLVQAVAGDTLIVKRAWDGTTLAAHTSPADIYASRAFTVLRGQLGSTAAAHADGADAFRLVPPGLVTDLTIAEAITRLQNEGAGYARTAGAGEAAREVSGNQLGVLREDCRQAHGRHVRIGAI